MVARKKSKNPPAPPQAYSHPEASSPARPEIGAQAHLKKSKPAAQYRYDSSLATELVWVEGNPARELAENLRGVWDHLAGTTSAPFEPGDERRIAVKVIDPRGNELLAVK